MWSCCCAQQQNSLPVLWSKEGGGFLLATRNPRGYPTFILRSFLPLEQCADFIPVPKEAIAQEVGHASPAMIAGIRAALVLSTHPLNAFHVPCRHSLFHSQLLTSPTTSSRFQSSSCLFPKANSQELVPKKKNPPPLDKLWASEEGVTPKAMAVVSVPPPGYRANVGVCLVNQNREVFVASRLDVPGSWQMPQGGVDKGEEPREAAFRELREETGITSAEIIGEVPEWLTYDFPPDVKAKITRLWGKEWTGQAQKWFLLRFTGDESEINLAGDGTEAAEFAEWKWLPVADVIKGAVEFKKPVYEQVFKVFSPMIESKVEAQ